jgi:hypothetical protein
LEGGRLLITIPLGIACWVPPPLKLNVYGAVPPVANPFTIPSEPLPQLLTSFLLTTREGEGTEAALNVILTLFEDVPHPGLIILHLNKYELPAVPVKVEVGLVGSPKEPPVPVFPGAKTQLPVPLVGVLAARVVIVALQIV